MLGWSGELKEDLDAQLWRTLVANRSLEGQTAPAWYHRACALALTNLDENGGINITALKTDRSQPSTMIEYLTRVQQVTDDRRIFRSLRNAAKKRPREPILGIGPTDTIQGDLVCILFDCSIPDVLRQWSDPYAVQPALSSKVTLIGPCYVHGHVEGEIFAGLTQEGIQNRSRTFNIY
jgi:hypothetical protein